MFTGLIEVTANILKNESQKLSLQRPRSFTDLSVGHSISVSGVCLTVSELDDASMTFDLTGETLSKTTLGDFQQGDHVNLERALKIGDRLGGHIVTGHVQGTGDVMETGEILVIRVPKELLGFIRTKGSVAVDGVSLTVANIKDDAISIALIPQTRKATTLGSLQEGDSVNLETESVAPRRISKNTSDWRVGIVYSSFYPEIVKTLVAGAKDALQSEGVVKGNITEHSVAGSFEIPLIGAALASRGAVDALIGIGIIVEGETHHAELIARETTRGMMDVQVRYATPFAFEVLYVKSIEQARDRSESGSGNKGGEAARAVLTSLAEIAKMHS